MRRPGLVIVLLLILLLGGIVAALLLMDPDEPAKAPPEAPVATPRGTGPGGEVPANTRTPQDGAKKRADGATAAEPAPAAEEAPAETPRHAPDKNPDVAVMVRVIQPGGAPATGATVSLINWAAKGAGGPSAKTDAEGRVRLTAKRSPGFLLLAEWQDYAASTPWIFSGDGPAGDVSREMLLQPAVRIRGKVLDPEGAPVQDAEVRVSFATESAWRLEGSLSAKTAADGAFSLPAVGEPPGGRFDVAVGARGFSPYNGAVLAKDAGKPVEIRLERGAIVRGRCVDEQGRVVVGARVHVDGRKIEDDTVSGADGRFELLGVAEYEGVLVVGKEGLATTAVRVADLTPREVELGDILLRVGGKIRGVVLDAEEKPAKGAQVTLHLEGINAPIASFFTGDDGTFLFDHVAPEAHALEATEGGSGTAWSAKRHATLSGVVPDAGEARIVLTGALGVRLAFLRESDRTPVKVASAELRAMGVGATPGNIGWAWMGPDGAIDAVRFEVETAGSYRIEITIPGYEKAVIDRADVMPDRELRIDVLFREPPK